MPRCLAVVVLLAGCGLTEVAGGDDPPPPTLVYPVEGEAAAIEGGGADTVEEAAGEAEEFCEQFDDEAEILGERPVPPEGTALAARCW